MSDMKYDACGAISAENVICATRRQKADANTRIVDAELALSRASTLAIFARGAVLCAKIAPRPEKIRDAKARIDDARRSLDAAINYLDEAEKTITA